MTDDLPEGWALCRVGDFFRSFSGGTPSKAKQIYWRGDIPWLSSGDIKADRISAGSEFISQAGLHNSSARLCRPGSVLVVVRSGVLKHTLPVAVLVREAAINQDIKCFDSDHDALNGWLALALRAFSKDILAMNREGTTVQSVKYDTLRQFQLPIPPASEQQRIVEKLGKLLAEVEHCKERMTKIPALLKRFRQSVLAAACSGRLTADWRDDKLDAHGLPPNWVTQSLDSLFKVETGGTPSRKKPEYFQNGSIPWVKTGEVQNRYITQTEESITEEALENSNAKVFPAGTILIAMYGEGKTRGQIGRLTFPAATNQACAALRNEALSETTVRYVYYFLLGQYYLLRAESVGGNQPNLNLGRIRSWEVVVPPMPEQKEIVARIEKHLLLADRIEERYRAAQKQVESLTQSILAKAFRGELVRTEAEIAAREGCSYESAARLLERIYTSNPTPSSSQKGRGAGPKC